MSRDHEAAVQTSTVLQYSVPAVVGIEWTTEEPLAPSCSNRAGRTQKPSPAAEWHHVPLDNESVEDDDIADKSRSQPHC